MVALPGMGRHLHLTEQGVHLIGIELASSADRAMAGQGAAYMAKLIF